MPFSIYVVEIDAKPILLSECVKNGNKQKEVDISPHLKIQIEYPNSHIMHAMSIFSNQCDQIWRNFAVLVKFLNSLTIFEDFGSNWPNLRPRYFGKSFMLLGKFQLYLMAKH